MEKKNDDLTVETPWGKVVSASGMETIALGLSKELEKIRQAITKINSKLKDNSKSDDFEDFQLALDALTNRVNGFEKQTLEKIRALEESHERIQTELKEFMDLTRKTLRLFKKKLEI